MVKHIAAYAGAIDITDRKRFADQLDRLLARQAKDRARNEGIMR
ncbi:MAG: hypothetical protein OEV81_04950 [Betaproteobacteria bacterium]|nr:hypothetical protein [Betaproteobacteria bacterium]